MSHLGSANMVHKLVAEFVQSMRSVEGVEKLVNLTGERLMKCSEEQDFEETLFRFYVENLVLKDSSDENSLVIRLENFWTISLETTFKKELFQKVNYVPLFDNLILERLVEHHQKEESRHLDPPSETSNLLEMSDAADSAEELFLEHKKGRLESLQMLGEIEMNQSKGSGKGLDMRGTTPERPDTKVNVVQKVDSSEDEASDFDFGGGGDYGQMPDSPEHRAWEVVEGKGSPGPFTPMGMESPRDNYFSNSSNSPKSNVQFSPNAVPPNSLARNESRDQNFTFGKTSQMKRLQDLPKSPGTARVLALDFWKMQADVNYLEIETYLESVVDLLKNVSFAEKPELVEIGDFSIVDEDFLKLHFGKEQDSTSQDSNPQNESRRPDFLEKNRDLVSKVSFLVKDSINDLMENISLNNILRGLKDDLPEPTEQTEFSLQDKNRLSPLNTLIYSVDFAELMCLLFKFAIRLLQYDNQREEERAHESENSEDEGTSKLEGLVFLMVHVLLRTLYGMAEIKLYELFYRESNLNFAEEKEKAMETMRGYIKETLGEFFEREDSVEVGDVPLSKRVSTVPKRDTITSRKPILAGFAEVDDLLADPVKAPEYEGGSGSGNIISRIHDLSGQKPPSVDRIKGKAQNLHSHNFEKTTHPGNCLEIEIDDPLQRSLNSKLMNETQNSGNQQRILKQSKRTESWGEINPNLSPRVRGLGVLFNESLISKKDPAKMGLDPNSKFAKLEKAAKNNFIKDFIGSGSDNSPVYGNIEFGGGPLSKNASDKSRDFSFGQRPYVSEQTEPNLDQARHNLQELISIQSLNHEGRSNPGFSISEKSLLSLLPLLNIQPDLFSQGLTGVKSCKLDAERVEQRIKGHFRQHAKSRSGQYRRKEAQNLREGQPTGDVIADSGTEILEEEVTDQDRDRDGRGDPQDQFPGGNGAAADFEDETISRERKSQRESQEFDDLPQNRVSNERRAEAESDGHDASSPDNEGPQQETSKEEERSDHSESMQTPRESIEPEDDHSEPSSNDPESPRETSRREITIQIDESLGNRPTNKYASPLPEENKATQSNTETHPFYVTSQKVPSLTENPPGFPSHKKALSSENTMLKFSEQVSPSVLLSFLKQNLSLDRVQVNDISIHISNFSEMIYKFMTLNPGKRIQFGSEREKREFLKQCRRLRSRVEGMTCRVVKVGSSYCSFFDKILYLFIEKFCDPDYMRGQINLQMKNKKFETLTKSTNVSRVKLTKPIFLKPFKLGKIPLFSADSKRFSEGAPKRRTHKRLLEISSDRPHPAPLTTLTIPEGPALSSLSPEFTVDFSQNFPSDMNSNPNHPAIPMVSELGSNFSITPRHNGNWRSGGPASPNPFVKKHRPQKSLTEKIRILNRKKRKGRERMDGNRIHQVRTHSQGEGGFFSSQKHRERKMRMGFKKRDPFGDSPRVSGEDEGDFYSAGGVKRRSEGSPHNA